MNKQYAKFVIIFFMLGVSVIALAMGVETVLDNVHSVTEGVVYRSAQPSTQELEKLIADLKLKSILNLRGVQTGSQWYRDEISISKKHRVAHYDTDLSAGTYVSPDRLADIVALIQAAPKPILIHCHGGADRSGLVSAAWKMSAEGTSLETAVKQLGITYGHFPYLMWRDSAAMDASFQDFAAALDRQRQPVSLRSN